MRRLSVLALVCVGVLILSPGCESRSSGGADRGRIRIGGQPVEVQFLTSNEERLKGVRRFPLFDDGDGALFVYPEVMPDLYWSNRHLLEQELSVAFIAADRTLIRMHRMTANAGRVVNAGEPARFLLVVPGGWFERQQVSVGDRLQLTSGIVESAEPVHSVDTIRSITVGDERVRVELARTAAQRRTGLMHRKALPENQGMLFLYSSPGRRSYHMKNTLIPLDIAFLRGDGTIAEVKQMNPLDQRSTRSSEPVMHVLEMRRGWFRDHGVEPGDQFDLTALKEFLPQPEEPVK